MIKFKDYINKCLEIKFSYDNNFEEFGKPMDCYGFVYWCYKDCLGKQLEKFNVQQLSDVKCIDYVEVNKPKDFDVVNIKSDLGISHNHIGIYYQGHVYHFTHNGLAVDRIDIIKPYVRGYYHAC